MATVGIIANPAASKDIRRLVAQGRVVPDWEKVNTIRRALIGLQSTEVERVVAMPDSGNLCRRAADDSSINIPLDMLPMSPLYTEGDTTRAAAIMAEMGVGCLITLGGDGTNRAVAMGTNQIPVVAISTGTNNIFPVMVEGTLAGIAAGLVASGRLSVADAAVVSKTLHIRVNGEFRELALVDVAISRERYVATRAIWDLHTVYEVFLTRAEPAGIGLSSIGGRLHPLSLGDVGGLRYRLAGRDDGENPATTVIAPVAPGMVEPAVIAEWQMLEEGVPVQLEQRYCTVALDGERSLVLTPEDAVEIVLARDGPPVVQAQRALLRASQLGLFSIK
ncbi:MAG: ATP-NAD kinase [Chloroflexi bacterium]|nr:ATP-NAD kinase [Chloroflexota bacterium]MYD47744.1 ATP-NAD kinase [Chloroflexota bacterium]